MADSSDNPDDSARAWTLSDLPWKLASRIAEENGHWQWTGSVSTRGYASVYYQGRQHLVHRLVYESLVGPIPHGYTIDHLCGLKSCSYPGHLEPVTVNENARRGSINNQRATCGKGHPMSGRNLYINPATGKRHCLQCSADGRRRQYRLHRARPRPGSGQQGLF